MDNKGPHLGEAGFLTAQFVVITALSLLILVSLANLIVVQYGRGVLRAAAEEGAQAGSRLFADASQCELKAQEVIDNLLGGAMGDDVSVSCTSAGGSVAALIDYSFEPWLPLVPDISGTEQSFAVTEALP